MATDNLQVQERFVKRVARYIADTELFANPAVYSSPMYHWLSEETGIQDLYADIKREQNQLALAMLDHVEAAIRAHDDQLHAAARVAGAGNLIDCGVGLPRDIEETLIATADAPFGRDETDRFFDEIKTAQNLLYVLDNAGEIVFDALFMRLIKEHYPHLHITAVVKAGPIINDALLEDVKIAGVDKAADKIIDTGGNYVGAPLDFVSPELKTAFKEADIFLCKGQGNFESLDEEKMQNGYFLLTAKCEIVAEALQVQKGRTVFVASRNLHRDD